jgi:peptidoglycan hydrolase-like protein with peptidoglycan-binding domain
LQAFVGFVEANRLDRHLRTHNWAKFARGYNGPQYRKNAYDAKMARAYEKYAAEPQIVVPASLSPGAPSADFRISTVRDLQTALAYMAINPGDIDNKMGPKTRAAIQKFERFAHLPEAGTFDATVKAAVQAAYYLMKTFDDLEKQNT